MSFFLSFSLLLLLLLPVFCFFLWWGQFVWQQKKQKGNSIDKRGGKKKLCFRISSLKPKAEVSQFLLTHTYLDTKKLHWFFLWYILFVHKIHHKNSHFPIPFHFMLKNLNFDAVFLPPKKGGSKAKNFTNT